MDFSSAIFAGCLVKTHPKIGRRNRKQMMLKNFVFTSLCLSLIKSSVWEGEAVEQVCDDGFKTRILLTSNSEGELTAYEVQKDDSNQSRLKKKWRQMTICSRENTFSARRHHDIYREF